MMKKRIWLIFFLLIFSLFTNMFIIIPKADEQVWENQYGKLAVEPRVSTNLIRQKQWYNATWYYPANTLTVAFRFNESLSYGKIFYWNGTHYNKLNPNHVIYNSKHYYVLDNLNFYQNQTRHGYWEYDVPPNSNGKWDMFLKLSSDSWQTAFEQNRYIHLDPWWNSTFEYKKEITIDKDQVVTDLPNFPVLINLSSDSDLASKAQNDGDDICFTNGDETEQLNHNIEFFDGATGKLIVWVNVTDLDADSDTSIWMYYGNPTCDSQEDEVNTWDGGYVAVYHMNTSWYDSTINRHNLTKTGDVTLTSLGYISDAADFGGAGYLRDASFLDFETQTEFSIEAWWYIKPSGTNKNVGIHINDGATSDRGIYTIHGDTPYDWTVLLKNAATQVSKVAGDFTSHKWYYVVSTGDDTNGVTLYIDSHNESESSGTVSFTDFPSTNIFIGHNRNINRYYHGRLDEIRISKVKRNESWITTSYNTMSNASDGDFFTLGIEYTAIAPDPPTNFTAITENSNINVTWTLGVNATTTVLERNTIYNWERGEGTFLYNDSGTYYLDTSSMSCATIYYYRGWSYNDTSKNFSLSNVSSNITCPGNPSGITPFLSGSTLNFTWTIGTYADTTVIVYKNDSYPSSVTDGTVLYNGSDTYYEDTSFSIIRHYKFYSYNDTINFYSTGQNAPFGALAVDVFDENTSEALTNWSIFISNQDGSDTYESLVNNNTLVIDIEDLPYGENTVILVNKTGYDQRVYYMNLEANTYYTLDVYLSETDPTELYNLRVVELIETGQVSYDRSVEDATVYIRRYINATVGYENITILLTDANGYVNVYLIPYVSYNVKITKDGYIDKIVSSYIPAPPNEWGQTEEKVFRIEREEPEEEEIPETILDTLTLTPYNSSAMEIYYLNLNDNNSYVIFNIYDHIGSVLLDTSNISTNPNNISFYFNFSGYSLSGDVLRVTASAVRIDSSIHVITKYFNIAQASRRGFATNAPLAAILSIGICLFGLTIAHPKKIFGVVGMIVMIIGIAVTAFAEQTWYIHLIQAVELILLVFIILTFKEEGVHAV